MSHSTVEPRRTFTLDAAQRADWDAQGYLIVRGVWTQSELDRLAARMDALRQDRSTLTCFHFPDRIQPGDPLHEYPRAVHPHLHDDLCRSMMIDARLMDVLKQLVGEEVLACQSMYYYKPPGARGQALHQDNIYLRVKPGTCYAAWTAVDPSIPANGGLQVVPGTHRMQVMCPSPLTPELEGTSFTGHYVPPPDGTSAVPAVMDPGDVLFFNGSIIHGSGPNTTKDLFRRSFICHYMPQSSEAISSFYAQAGLLDRHGQSHAKTLTQDGGACGDDQAGQPANF